MNDRQRLKNKIVNRIHGKLIKRALSDAKDALRQSKSVKTNAYIAINEAKRARCLYIERDFDCCKAECIN